ncbi:MAG: AAC(3) family N-acetyltransferase [Pseudomonadota bacterium]|nr:AAC(3) family N-acetyltransferase [Pseudomonadota bacterium]
MPQTRAHYTAADLDAALNRLPLERGDVLFLHSNLGFFGRPEGCTGSADVCHLFFDTLMRRLGGNGTLVVPTFTYSFPRRQLFDPAETASGMGAFAEWLRLHPDAQRSHDPCYSVAAVGAHAETLTAHAPENSFAPEAFFGRFLNADGVVLNLNFDAGSTFLHYLERQLGVPYRFDKTFEGHIRERGETRRAKSTIHVRYLSSEATVPVFEPFHALATEAGLFVTEKLGRGRLGCIRASDCRHLLTETLPRRPWLLTRAEALGVIPELIPEPTYQAL